MVSRFRHAAPGWLIAVAAATLVAGVIAAAFVSSSAVPAFGKQADAQAEVETQEGLVADAQQDLADLQVEIENERAALDQATAAVEQAESALNTAEVDVSASRADLLQAEAEIPMRRDEARAFVNAVAPLVDAVAARVEYERQMLNLRAAQVEAGLTGDFSAFNGSQDDLNAMAETVNADVDAIAATVAALPSLTAATPLQGPGSARFVASDAVLDPPTGKARVEATAAEVIECMPWGVNGCTYHWVVTFAETNWLPVTIEEIAVRYDERGRRAYWYSENGEWSDVSIVVPAGGTATHDGGFRTDGEDDMKLVIGGKLKLRYKGTDADDNAISGSLTVPLERP